MKVFEVKPDDDGFPYNYYIDAVHKWGLPGVRCPACGFTGGAVGVSYPDLSLPVGVEPEPYETHWPVAPSRVRELARPLRTVLAEELPIPAGTEFGPLCGKASGRFGDLTWLNPWTPLISAPALENLLAKGISGLKIVAAEIILRSKTKKFEHAELCLYPVVHAHEPNAPRECSECAMPLERVPHTADPYTPVILKDRWPKGVHLARLYESPPIIVASEQFVHATNDLRLTDIKFIELEVR